MRFMVIVKASKDSEAGVLPTQEQFAEMGKFNEELVKAGIMLAGDGLHPSSKGARVRFSGTKRTVIDGPFAETKELVAGFWIWQCKSLQEAIEWVKRCPNPMNEDSEIEIRQFYSPEDFGEAFTPELQEQENRLRTEAATYNLDPPRFENGKEMTIAGYSESYTPATRTNIPKHWERFSYHLGKVPGQVGANAYGVCTSCSSGGNFDYLTGVEVSDTTGLPKDFTHVRIPATRYVVFTHRQHISTIGQAIEAIWCKWLPNSGLTAAQSPSFERYTPEFNPHTGMGGTEIWVPIKA